MKNQSANKILILFFVCFVYNSLFSQEIRVSGIVVDSLTSENIPYATVYFKNTSDSIIMLVYTDNNGKFSIPINEKIDGKLVVSFMGYKNYTAKVADVLKLPQPVTIKLCSDVVLLNAANVNAEMTIIKKIDREEHIITEAQKDNANSIYDILKSLPGVVVDEQNKTITFKGGAPEVLVDNMPAAFIYPKLDIIRLEDIESIELIDRSVLYGGEGAGGIINIKLKKEKFHKFGAYASNNTRYAYNDKNFSYINNFLNVNYLLGPVFLFNNLDYRNSYNNNFTDGEGTFFLSNNKYLTIENIAQKTIADNLMNITGLMIPAERFSFIMAYAYEYSNSNISQTDILNTSNINYLNTYNINSLINSIPKGNYYFAKLMVPGKKGSELSLQYTRGTFNTINNSTTDRLTTFSSIDTTYNRNDSYSTNSKMKGYTYNVDFYYNQPIKTKTLLNVHGNLTRNVFPENSLKYYLNDVQYYDLNKNDDLKDKHLTTGITLGRRFSNGTLSATVNYVNNYYDAIFTRYVNNSDSLIPVEINNHFFSPSIRYSAKINDKSDYYLGYSYTNRVNSPDNYLAFIDKQNPNKWVSGNSDLQPEYYHNTYISYRFTTDSLRFTTELFYKYTQNGVARLNYPYYPNVYINLPENIAKNQITGIDLMFWWRLNYRFGITANSTIKHNFMSSGDLKSIAIINGVEHDEIIRRQFGTKSRLSFLRYPNNKGWGNSLYFELETKEITITGYKAPLLYTGYNIERLIFDNLAISLNLLYGLNYGITRYEYYDYAGIINKRKYDYTYDRLSSRIFIWYNFNAGHRGSKDISIK